jgi:glc operon protein GlcG
MASRHRLSAVGFLVLCVSTTLFGQLGQKPVIELPLAKEVMAVAEKEVVANRWGMFVVIVDDSGLPIMSERVGDPQPGSYDVAVKKARAAALFRRPTKYFEDLFKSGTLVHTTVDDVIALEGGIPLALDNQVVGAVGVSGGSSVQDGQVAAAAANAFPGLAAKK